ncbi:MAG TPA: glycosyl hydrolase family 8 [Chthoniobacteraceae bacterium]|nr:glycosyl hydrolase family 8 [Chthoniobacteraceae bacterium]
MSRHILRRLALALLAQAAAFSASAGSPPAHPFPQHTAYTPGAIKPSHVSQAELDDAARHFYQSWKKTYLVTANEPGQLYVLDDEESRSGGSAAGVAVSEGQGYGMLITAFMAGADAQAHELFDGLYRYFRAQPSKNNPQLMAWRRHNGAKAREDDEDSATDGDLDIAQALLLADAQWGRGGAVDYRAEARRVIAAIKKDEVNRERWTIKLGDWATPDDDMFNSTRPSDFMADHFRSFASATGDRDWQKVTDACYRLVAVMQANFSPATGLLPDFITSVHATPAPPAGKHLEGKHDGHYYYNSCRVPLRLGVDFLMHGEPRAKSALEKINAWVETEAGGKPENVAAGYELDGRPADKHDRSLAFTACFGVGAMTDAAHQRWLNTLWDYTVATDSSDDLYFARTLKMLCLIAMSGNWWSPAGGK